MGDKQATCTSSAVFDTVIPTCEEIVCPRPPVREHMITTTHPEAEDGKYKPYTVIEYECEDGKTHFEF